MILAATVLLATAALVSAKRLAAVPPSSPSSAAETPQAGPQVSVHESVPYGEVDGQNLLLDVYEPSTK